MRLPLKKSLCSVWMALMGYRSVSQLLHRAVPSVSRIETVLLPDDDKEFRLLIFVL